MDVLWNLWIERILSNWKPTNACDTKYLAYLILFSAKCVWEDNLCANQIAGPVIMQLLRFIENGKSCFVDRGRKVMS